MPTKLVIAGINAGVQIDEYHKLDLTLEPDPVTGYGPELVYLVTTGTTTASVAGGGIFMQLAETNNVLTKVTITGSGLSMSDPFGFGAANSGDAVVTDIAATATSPTTIHSSLKLIDASATTGFVQLYTGATNTSSAGHFVNGSTLNSNITVTYDGLKIKGGSGQDIIENDATNGVVTEGNHGNDCVILGGAGASATLGTGANDQVAIGATELGTNEAPGQALGETVTFGAGATAELFVGDSASTFFSALGHGAEAGSTAGTPNIGQTNVHGAAAGMLIDFHAVTTSNTIANENAAIATATSLTAAENAAVAALGAPGVAYFNYHHDEYLIATNSAEPSVSATDAIVHLVGVSLTATNSGGIVTLA